MSTRLIKLTLATLISASIGVSPFTVMAADPAPAGVPAAAPVATPDTQPEKGIKKTAKKSKKDKKAEKKAKKKSQKKVKATQEPAAPQQ
ncbi:protein tyrosine phosphatase [Polynucleobacter sp. AP-Elch-400A-B2]|uniref:protein tyrosine phosphatase n=1 Tax=Polynucleobacter sp. AP-Elch-400A-B2 TaxID=2576930 RepID=UPI001BFDA8B9|nr:protein tyrosine phosphatase [Polynucleobacter sp. AP-Elch-400A-B2]QWE23936.1 protein tyrosine phosphatase [Polynucleobacter sp. AP-Elch-400A-B2]